MNDDFPWFTFPIKILNKNSMSRSDYLSENIISCHVEC